MMTPEMQTLVDRIEVVERQARTWRTIGLLTLVLALGALALSIRVGGPGTTDHARFSVVEANRILLRDADGSLAGGLESLPDGTLRFVLGNRSTASAHLLVRRDGEAQFSLRSPDQRVHVALVASPTPSLWISPDGQGPTVALSTDDTGAGQLIVRDALGRARFRAP